MDVPERSVRWGGSLWLVLTQTGGLVLAGTGDLSPVRLVETDLPALRQLQRGHVPDDARSTELAEAIAHRGGGRSNTDPPEAPRADGPACTLDTELAWVSSLVLRMVGGRLFGWSLILDGYVELSDSQFALLTMVSGERHLGRLARSVPGAATAAGGLVHHGLLEWAGSSVVVDDDPDEPNAEAVTATIGQPRPSMLHRVVRRAVRPIRGLVATDPAVEPTRGDDSEADAPADDAVRDVEIPSAAPRPVPAPPPAANDPRIPVWPGTCASLEVDGAPLALGMIVSALRWYGDGRLLTVTDIQPIRIDRDEILADVAAAGRPGVVLLSNYFWTIEQNLELATAVKAISPDTVTVFGGPSAPKYEAEAADFLAAHGQVDILVRGEGEITACELIDALAASRLDVRGCRDVAGLTYRDGAQVIRTGERERLADLNVIPSPYLTGLFDHLDGVTGTWAIESNRGCPYGCTFCDWGAATLSRVRKFDLDRVKAEVDWLAEHRIKTVFIADANFGIFERDLEVAERFAVRYLDDGFPSEVVVSFAKNTTKYTVPIVDTFVESGLMGEGTISFQTTDPGTLANIRRKNIKLDTYNELASEMRERKLPILADLMIGLPGSTLETFKNDLQVCIDGEVKARIFATFVLPNSPMNDPEYRTEFAIRTDSMNQVIQTSSYDLAEREAMVRLADMFRLAEHFGVLRQVMRYVAAETGRREIDVLTTIHEVAQGEPDRYPITAFHLLGGRLHLTVPLSWGAFLDEVAHIVVTHLDVPDDSALRTVIELQAALLPAPGRAFPLELSLEHDYVAYYHDVIRPADDVPPLTRELRDYGPGTITIDDPAGWCVTGLTQPWEPTITPEGSRYDKGAGGWVDDLDWELESPLTRPLRAMRLMHTG